MVRSVNYFIMSAKHMEVYSVVLHSVALLIQQERDRRNSKIKRRWEKMIGMCGVYI